MEDTNEEKLMSTLPALDIRVSEDKMTVYVSCPRDYADNTELYDGVAAALQKKGVAVIPDQEKVNEMVKHIHSTGESLTDWPLVVGVLPIEPENGRLEWQGEFFHTGYHVDPETKRIDFRQRAGNPNVEKGQLLVRVIKAKMGQDGKDVFGRKIIVRKPVEVHLKGGPNVYWDDKQSGFLANSAGRVILRGKILDIDPVFFVKHGVGTESGNIKHNGPVVIDGEVESEFKVEATGDIEIRGLAYACDITCGGNLMAKEGINSNTEKRINVTGDVFAKYLQNAQLESGGNVIVNSEIFQCDIKTKGEVVCNNGRIIGGNILATKGITAGEVGSKGNVKTVLVAGFSQELKHRRSANCQEISRLKEMKGKLEKVTHKLRLNQHLLTNEQKETLTEIQFKISDAEEEISRLEEVNKKLHEKIRENCKAEIRILQMVHSGTCLRICDSQYDFDQTLTGPIVASLDPIQGDVVLSSDLEDEGKEENESREH